MDFKKMLEEVQTTVKDAISTARKDIVKEVNEGIEIKVEDAIKPINERLEKIEKLPAGERPKAPDIFVPEIFEVGGKRYKIHEQGEQLREKLATRPKWYRTLSNDQQFDEYTKWLLTAVAAMKGDIKAQMQLQEAREKATDMAEGTPNVGGYLVPVDYQMDLIKLARERSFALQECTVVPMNTLSLKLPSEATLVTSYWVDEAGAITASNPTFGQVTLTAKKLAGLTSSISQELLDDSGIDIVSLLTEQFAYAMALELDNQVLNGSGSPVSGLLTAACGYSVSLASTSTSFSAVNADIFRQMIKKVSKQYRQNGKFCYHGDLQYYIDTLKDSNDRYIYREPAGSRPEALWNRPIIESTQAPQDSDSSADTAFSVFGDWRYFYLGRRKGFMSLDVDPYTNFATDEVRYRMTTRWALAIALSTAFCRGLTAES